MKTEVGAVATNIAIRTSDGLADCFFVHPESGQHPGIIMWPDILGLRGVFESMAKRLSEAGYSVLVVNPFYRSAIAPVVPEGADIQAEPIRNAVYKMMGLLSMETTSTDARAFVDFLGRQPAVDGKRKIGAVGYCLGGHLALLTAAASPDRIGAAASFHGSGLVTNEPDSPHRFIPTMRANVLIAIAEDDDERNPDVKDSLRKSFDATHQHAEIEVYEGARHGWCIPGSHGCKLISRTLTMSCLGQAIAPGGIVAALFGVPLLLLIRFKAIWLHVSVPSGRGQRR